MISFVSSSAAAVLLAIACGSSDSDEPAALRVGETVTAVLRSQDPHPGEGAPAPEPRVTFTLIADSDGPITLSVDSYDFDPLLRLETASGDLREQDDNGGIAWNVRLVVEAKAGESYRAVVIGGPGPGGEFTIAAAPGDVSIPFGDARYDAAIKFHRAAAARASARGDKPQEVRHRLDEGDEHFQRGGMSSSRSTCMGALALAREIGARDLVARALRGLGRTAAAEGNVEEAVACLRAALAMSREIGDAPGEGRSLQLLGGLENNLDRFDRALALLEASILSSRRAADSRATAQSVHWMGVAHENLGDKVRARETYERALGLATSDRDARSESAMLLSLAMVHFSMGDSAQAQRCAEASRLAGRRVGVRVAEARAVGVLADLSRFAGDFATARERFKEQLALAIECGDRHSERAAMRGLGRVHYETAVAHRAIPYFERCVRMARESAGPMQEAHELMLLGAAQARFGGHEASYASAKLALAIALETRARVSESDALGYLGSCLLLRGDYRGAEACLERAFLVARGIGDTEVEARAISKLGSLYSVIGRLRESRACSQALLRLAQQDQDDRLQIEALKILASSDLHEGRLAAAEERLKLALAKSLERSGGRRSYTIDRSLGWLRRSRKRYADARILFDRALSYSLRDGHPLDQADVMGDIGLTHLVLKDFDQASAACLESLRVSDGFGDDVVKLVPLYVLARVALAHQDEKRCGELLDQAERILEQARGKMPSSTDASTWRGSWAAWGEVGHDLAVLRVSRLGRDPLERSRAVSEGFASADRWKGRELLQRINQLRAGTRWFEGVALRREQKEVLARRDQVLERLSESIRAGRPVAEVDKLREESKALDAQAERLSRRLLVHSPQESSSEWSRRVDPEEVRGVLDEQTALIEYAEGDERLYAYVLTARDLTFHDVGEKEAIYSDARALIALVSSPPNDGTTSFLLDTAKGLHASLVAPLLPSGAHGIERLVIVPTPALATLPFEALLASPPSGGPVDSLARARFLIDDFEVSYAPSTSVLVELSGMGPRVRPGKALILADPLYLSERSDLPPPPPPADDLDPTSLRGDRAGPHPREIPRLAKTRDEALAVAELFARRRGAGPLLAGIVRDQRSGAITTEYADLLFGAEASPEKLLRSLEEYSILHFAAHGFVDPEFPERSGLALAFTNEEDGYLGIEDVLDLDLDADLVVLSACATARGTVRFGEGVQSMARAFLFAGARRVVATLWKIADEEAAQTMSGFYRAMLESGMAPPAALRHAKRSLRSGLAGASTSSESRAHPFYWAPFIHIGLPR